MKKRILIILCMALSATSMLFAAGAQEQNTTASGPIEIYFWHTFSDAARRGWVQDRADEFNASQSTYKVIPEVKGSYPETLQAAILAAKQGEAPHLVHVYEVGSRLAYDSGIFMPISEIGSFDTSDYIAPVLNYYTINGKVNSIPFNSSSPVLYINTDMVAAAGYPANYVPETLEDMITVTEAARANGVQGANISFSMNGWFFEQWMSEQNALLMNNDNGRTGRATEVNLTSPEAMKIANFIAEIGKKGLYSYTGKFEDWDGSDAIFTSGKAIFHITSTADLGNIERAVGEKFTMGVGMLPIPEGSQRNGTVIGGGSVWAVADHPMKELEGARDFILYMTNTENMVSWHKLTGYYPVRTSSVEALKAEGWFDSDAKQLVAFNQLLNTKPNYASAGALAGIMQINRDNVEKAFQKILQGTPASTAMAEAKVLSDTALAEYNANY